MKKKCKNILRITLGGCLCAVAIVIGYMGFCYCFAPIKFDSNKVTQSNLAVYLYDSQKRPLEHTYANGDYVSLNQIPKFTIDCFISTEDKSFYSHHGLNYKRIVGAMAKNISSMSFKEGASTISQQLIKNTHLSSKKSIKRKINEIKLTMQLEREFTKDQILEYYLNAIYFGDNCYGIQNASEHYFSKPVTKLTIDESAVLAGLIKSPQKYHPVNQYSSCIKRRNVVLHELYEDGKISKEEFDVYRNHATKIAINSKKISMNSFARASILEAEKILKMPEKQIAIGKYRIYTHMDKEKQTSMENSIDKALEYDCAMISLNAKTGCIEAYVEKSSLPLVNVKRQPASSIKPILVYAPALNQNIITPSTVILDEKISINGYEPKNIGNVEHGYISAKQALSNSLNIPAVKVLSYVGLDSAKNYLQMQNVQFDPNDNNLALALGGMTYGMTLKDLTNCYQTLANNGNYIQSKYIDYIVDNSGKVVYKSSQLEKNIYRDDTAFLVTDMLKCCSKKGTAKRLSDLPFEVASKTGTSSISASNIDAYNISYTTEDVVGCWIGNVDNLPITIVGGGQPTIFVKNYLTGIYKSHNPSNFTVPSSVVEYDIDTCARDNDHIIYRANNFLPERYREKAYFSRFNEPKVNTTNKITLEPITLSGRVENGVAILSFNAEIYCSYEIYKMENSKIDLIGTLNNKKGFITYNVSQNPNSLCKYYVKTIAKMYNSNQTIQSENSNTVELYYTN